MDARNKYAEGLDSFGRPPIYSDPEALHTRVIQYFESIRPTYDAEGEIISPGEYPTILGLTLYLGFCSKSTLYEYAKKKDFSDSIKRALAFVEKNYEETLFSKASTGAIFALKNMGWTDKQEIEHQGGIEIIRRIIK